MNEPETSFTNPDHATNTTIFEIVEEINNQQQGSTLNTNNNLQKIVKTTIFSEQEASNEDEPDFILSQTVVNTVIKSTTNGHSINGNDKKDERQGN